MRRLARVDRWFAAALAVVAFSGGVASAADVSEYVHANAWLSGVQIHAFQDAGESVTVVFGDFRLTAGAREVTGRNAVIWIDTDASGGVTRYDLTIYVEGDAKVTEPGGQTTRDKTMLIRMGVQGRLRMRQKPVRKPLVGYELYKRAQQARKTYRPGRPVRRGMAPVLIYRGPSAETRPARQPPDAATPPSDGQAGPETPPDPDAGGRAEPAEPDEAPQPVDYYAEHLSAQVIDNERVLVARGNVLLSQGAPDSAEFLELRAQAAVLFTARTPAKDARSPQATEVEGFAGDLPDPNGTGFAERVVGVYLEGDVVISRGERYLRGPKAYYDFRTDRALMVDPVLRSRQKQRNIPIFVRAKEVRALSAREMLFTDAIVTTSDFYTPTYHVGAKTAYIKDQTPYGPEGMQIGERSWYAEMKHATFNIRGLPVAYVPYQQGELTDTDTAIRRVQAGYDGKFGFGVETEWYLFRLLGLLAPKGYEGRLSFDWYERGLMGGTEVNYRRENYSGYAEMYGLLDREQEDDFGRKREDIPAPAERGRLLLRHKHELPRNWELQLELSYLCDRNFLEQFFPAEFWSGKEQETLAYAKKQEENWAFTALVKTRINDFLTQTESLPELAVFLPGEPLAGGLMTWYSENRAGWVRYRPDEDLNIDGSDHFFRADTRQEVDFPMHFGPINVLPFAVGRLTYWEDNPPGGANCRKFGQIGARMNLHLWRVYENAESRLWDIHGLRHVITPELQGFLAGTSSVQPSDLYPMDPGIEEHVKRKGGWSFGVHQRLMTRRGSGEQAHTVEWMRFSAVAGFYNTSDQTLPADGRYFFYRPEYSLDRDHVNLEYVWHISDATVLMFDTNYDIGKRSLRRINGGLSVHRSPRLAYFVGMRAIRDLNSAVLTVGANYQLTRKYSFSAMQMYDLDYDDGTNLVTQATIVRKFPRWYVGLTVTYSEVTGDTGVMLALWPQGVPEFRLGGSTTEILAGSDQN